MSDYQIAREGLEDAREACRELEKARGYCRVTMADFDNAAAWKEHLDWCHPGHAHRMAAGATTSAAETDR